MIDRLLFHWSPRDRRDSIAADGFVPGSRSTDDEWNSPYVCFAYSPSKAWSLSGMMPRGRLVPEWDLWTCWTSRLPEGAKVKRVRHQRHERETGVKELRVYAAIPAADIWWVGSRGVSERVG